MFKKFFLVSVLASSVGVPYLVNNSKEWLNSLGSFGGSSESELQVPDVVGGEFAIKTGSKRDPLAKTAALPKPEGAIARDLGEIFQFEATPQWVMSRWPRVTAGLAELDLHGYRVPLVTGTGTDDLAGSLTYYFDKHQRVAHITFQGTTGDPRKLVGLLTNRYSFLPQRTNDPALGLYQVKWNGKPQSELRVRTAGVLRADQPNARYELELALKRP